MSAKAYPAEEENHAPTINNDLGRSDIRLTQALFGFLPACRLDYTDADSRHYRSSTVDYSKNSPTNCKGGLFTFTGVCFMAKRKNGVNKSEEIRQMLRANPKVTAKEVKDALRAKGIKISDKLYYLVKGKMLGKQSRKKKAKQMVAKVAESNGTGNADALSTILKVKSWANQVGGLKKLKALVDALSE